MKRIVACRCSTSFKSVIKRSIMSPIFPHGYATNKDNCSAESEIFQCEEEHLQFLESISILPKGFQVGTSSFDFNPVELPTMDANMNMTVISLDKPSKNWAALFTKNAFPGAPIIYGRKLLQSGKSLKGIVINNKISNVSSSSDGVQDAKDVANACLHFLNNNNNNNNNNTMTVEDINTCVLPSSTGIIGWRLPTDKMIENLKLACSLNNIQSKSILPAAKAIMTTDMFAKVRSVNIELNNESYKLVGIAKGAGMVEPNMATMLVYLLTDAPIDQNTLQKILKRVVDKTFNCISIDSDMSTSDTIVAISSNTSKSIKLDDHAKTTFEDAMFKVCDRLCEDVVRNGEGVKHVIKVHIKESISFELANGIGKAIVNSPLFKAAINGNDPNVGRLLSAIGDYLGNNRYSTLDNMKIEIGDTLIYENAKFLINESVESRLKKVLEDSQMFNSEPHIILDEQNGNVEQVLYPVPSKYPKHQKCVDIIVSLGMENGEEEAVVRGADLTHEYVTENGAYRS
jgi:glutamate N-acetyltransferase / amino-acid N-acetyltransferase